MIYFAQVTRHTNTTETRTFKTCLPRYPYDCSFIEYFLPVHLQNKNACSRTNNIVSLIYVTNYT